MNLRKGPTMAKEKLPSIDIVLDEARRKLDYQFKQHDTLITKSGIVLGVDSVVFPILVTNLLGTSSQITDICIAILASLSIFTSLIMSFIPIYIRKWNRPPNLYRLREYYIAMDLPETKLNIIDRCLSAVDENQKLLDKLFRIVKLSYLLLLLGLVMLAIWIGMTIW